ncbi:MAG: hypothetical protein IPM18_17300 [Phycisphaerales bacterium]|nr:hypothetical protein [Phycisphaerales bacterium]
MSTSEQIAKVRSKLLTALDAVRQELAKFRAGEPAVGSERELLVVIDGLEEMLSGLTNAQRPQAPGVGHIVVDTWPLHSPVGERVLEAEYAYERLK